MLIDLFDEGDRKRSGFVTGACCGRDGTSFASLVNLFGSWWTAQKDKDSPLVLGRVSSTGASWEDRTPKGWDTEWESLSRAHQLEHGFQPTGLFLFEGSVTRLWHAGSACGVTSPRVLALDHQGRGTWYELELYPQDYWTLWCLWLL